MVGAVLGKELPDFEEAEDEDEAEEEEDPAFAGTPLIVLPVGCASLSQPVPLLAAELMPVELPEEVFVTLLRLLFAAIYAAAPIATRHSARAM